LYLFVAEPTTPGHGFSRAVGGQLLDAASAAEACSTAGPEGRLMKPVTAKLTVDDMISLASYLATLHP
jgi:hypothetical protein